MGPHSTQVRMVGPTSRHICSTGKSLRLAAQSRIRRKIKLTRQVRLRTATCRLAPVSLPEETSTRSKAKPTIGPIVSSSVDLGVSPT